MGGYLHLVEPFPDFCDYMEKVTDEFRLLKSFHNAGAPYVIPGKVMILTAWGSLRAWTCSGHLHEHPEVDLINIIESLSGLPFEVEFKSFEDIKKDGIGKDVKVIINAGVLNSAWSGGDNWKDAEVTAILTEWVANGGGFIGVNEPSATDFSTQFFQMSHVLGVDKDLGTKKCLGKYNYDVKAEHFITAQNENVALPYCDGVFVLDGSVEAYAHVTYGLLMSGLAMQMLGTSRPASGAEHHVSHFIEVEPAVLSATPITTRQFTSSSTV